MKRPAQVCNNRLQLDELDPVLYGASSPPDLVKVILDSNTHTKSDMDELSSVLELRVGHMDSRFAPVKSALRRLWM